MTHTFLWLTNRKFVLGPSSQPLNQERTTYDLEATVGTSSRIDRVGGDPTSNLQVAIGVECPIKLIAICEIYVESQKWLFRQVATSIL